MLTYGVPSHKMIILCLHVNRPQELELLACGGQQLDLEALESATIHDDGYTRDSQVCHLGGTSPAATLEVARGR